MRYCILFLISVFTFYSCDTNIPLKELDTQLLKSNIYTVDKTFAFAKENMLKSNDAIEEFTKLGNTSIQVTNTFPYENVFKIQEYNLVGKKFMGSHTFLYKIKQDSLLFVKPVENPKDLFSDIDEDYFQVAILQKIATDYNYILLKIAKGLYGERIVKFTTTTQYDQFKEREVMRN